MLWAIWAMCTKKCTKKVKQMNWDNREDAKIKKWLQRGSSFELHTELTSDPETAKTKTTEIAQQTKVFPIRVVFSSLFPFFLF